MSEIYALGIIGDPEVRYIGVTKYSGQARLRQHLAAMRYTRLRRRFNDWLAENADQIEVRIVASFDDERAAWDAEKAAIVDHANAGHRLLNSEHNPALTKGDRRMAKRLPLSTPEQVGRAA